MKGTRVSVDGISFALVAVAALALANAWSEAGAQTWGHGVIGGGIGCLVGFLALRRLGACSRTPSLFLLLCLLLFFAPSCWDKLQRTLWGLGSGAEYLLLAGLTNLGFVFCGSGERRLRRLTLPLGLGVTVFGMSLSQGALGTIYALLAVALTVLALAQVPLGAPRRSMMTLLVPVLVVFSLGIWLTLGKTASPLGGLLWGSGGGGESDPFGRGGVGNGDGEVSATKKTEDIGFAHTDITVESEKRTLFDAVSELYGEPEALKKTAPRNRKATFLAKEILEKPKGPQVAPSATKSFSIQRSAGKPAAVTKNDPAKALLYVSGRTPLHLRLTGYDHFEGNSWKEGTIRSPREIVTRQGNDWMSVLSSVSPALLGAQEQHEVKFGLLITDRLPTPAGLMQVRIERLSQPDFYQWAQPGILRLDQIPQVPPGVRLELKSRTVDHKRLQGRPLDPCPDYMRHRSLHYRLPDDLDPRVAALAHEWVKGVPPGWKQVEAIMQRLRSHAKHDPQARPPKGCPSPVSWFLFEGRSGPDYLFATTAALLVRALGYPSRLVNGIYVSGTQRDFKTGHQLVFTKDLHFWVEVESPADLNEDRLWVPFEPTPGYTLLSPIPTLADRCREALEGARRSLSRHLAAWITTLAALTLSWHSRRWLQDALWTLHWHVWARRAPRHAVLAALQLLERRAKWAGVPRKAGQTLSAYCQEHDFPEARTALKDFLRALDQVLYASPGSVTLPTHASQSAAVVLRHWTQRNLKETQRR